MAQALRIGVFALTEEHSRNIMNPTTYSAFHVPYAAGVLCLGLATFIGVQCLEREGIQCRGAYRRTASLDEPKATDYAHAVPATSPKASSSPKDLAASSLQRKSLAIKSHDYDGSWYRCALPLSTACFLLSFGVWSLQSQPNHAIRPIEASAPVSSPTPTTDSEQD